MKTKYTQYCILLLFIINGIISYGQETIQVNFGKDKQYIISDFEEDSVQSFNNIFVAENAITPITQSPAYIELRYYTGTDLLTHLMIYSIKYFGKGRCIIEKTQIRYDKHWLWNAFDSIGQSKITNAVINKRTSKKYLSTKYDSLFINLDSLEFFKIGKNYLNSLVGKKELVYDHGCMEKINSLINRHGVSYIPLMKIFAFGLYEIKVGNKFRSFYPNIFKCYIYNNQEKDFVSEENVGKIGSLFTYAVN